MTGLHYVRTVRKGRVPRWYVYAWRSGPLIAKIDMHQKPVLPRKSLEKVFAEIHKKRRVDQGTLRSLIQEWRSYDPQRPSSPEWNALPASTKRSWGAALDLIEKAWGELPLELWDDPQMTGKLIEWRDARAATPRAADTGIATLRALLAFGQLRGRIASNVAGSIPTLCRDARNSVIIIWTDEDLDRFADIALKRGRLHVLDGLRLAALTGLGREDLVTLSWDQVSDLSITKERNKGKRGQVRLPMIPALDELLQELRGRARKQACNTVLVNSYGEPWSAGGFRGSFNRIRDEADICHVDEVTGERIRKRFQDLRSTICAKLITLAKVTDQQLADLVDRPPDRVATMRGAYSDQSLIGCTRGRQLRDVGTRS